MKRILIALLAAVALCGVAAYSWADGARHGHDTDPLAVIATLQAQLKLNTSQQLQFNNALAQSKAAHDAMRSGFAQLKAATQTELAKSAPDLGVAGGIVRSGAAAEQRRAQAGARGVARAVRHPVPRSEAGRA